MDDHQQYMQTVADELPCACGKRAKAYPQIPVGELCEHRLTGCYGGERDYLILTQSFQCGVCRQVHKLGRRRRV